MNRTLDKSNYMRSTQSKFIQPLLERNDEIDDFKSLPKNEQINLIKMKFNLYHGKGKRKRYKK